MIKSFAHKGLELFFHTGNLKGVQARHSTRLRLILDLLDMAKTVRDMNFPGSCLHMLKGDLAEHWAVNVSGNWRIHFALKTGTPTL